MMLENDACFWGQGEEAELGKGAGSAGPKALVGGRGPGRGGQQDVWAQTPRQRGSG